MLQIFLEQKKMLKTGLNIAHFKEHVRIIEAETREYFQRWGDSGERSKILDVPIDRNFFQFCLGHLKVAQPYMESKRTQSMNSACFRPV